MNSPLLVVLPFCNKDVQLATNLLAWIDELRVPAAGIKERLPHSLLLVADSKVKRESVLYLKSFAASIFHFVEGIIVAVPDDRQSWPKGPNFMFHNASQVVQDRYRLPWLWLEPDCVPMRPEWLSELSAEYAVCPKQFMGTMATVALSPDLPEQHMSGVAVYPPNAHSIMKEACASDIAFDYASSAAVLGRHRAWETKLIHEIWGSHAEVPTFKEIKAPEDKNNVLVPALIPKSAALFHRCKDGSLINLMRKPGDRVVGLAPVVENMPEVLKEMAQEVAVEQAHRDAGAPPPRKSPKMRIGVPESKMAAIP